MDILDMLDRSLLIVIPALWIIGRFFKGVSCVPNRAIPWILLCVAFAVCSIRDGLSVDGFINAVILAGIAVYGHELVKETFFSRRSGEK